MNQAQITKLAEKAAARQGLTERAVEDLRQRVDTNYAMICSVIRRQYADEVFTLEDDVLCAVRDLPRWAFVEWLNICHSNEFDAMARAARMRSIEAVEKRYGVYLKEERNWYAYLEEAVP